MPDRGSPDWILPPPPRLDITAAVYHGNWRERPLRLLLEIAAAT
jgi:hypothetical protein